jgi:hypothetical protein
MGSDILHWYNERKMNGHECGSVATSKRPSLNGFLLDSKTVYVEHPPGFEAFGKED